MSSASSELSYLSDDEFEDDAETQSANTRYTNTHNSALAFEHITGLEWITQLDAAIKQAWPKRHVMYDTVSVLMISWEETSQDAMRRELDGLEEVFRCHYRYSVERWLIPSVSPAPAMRQRVGGFMDRHSRKPKTLVILYYAGHTRINEKGDYPFWVPSSTSSVQVSTAGIHDELVSAPEGYPDVLLIYDCCFATTAQRSSSGDSRAAVEGLFAGGFESRVPIAGPDSFTSHLTEVLGLAVEQDLKLTVIELHHRVLARLQHFQPNMVRDQNRRAKIDPSTKKVVATKRRRVSPVHLFFGDPILRLITLSPLPLENGEQGESSSEPPNIGLPSFPKVMLAVRLADGPQNEYEFKEWLLKAPEGVVEFKSKETMTKVSTADESAADDPATNDSTITGDPAAESATAKNPVPKESDTKGSGLVLC
ncbi:hypothetical protein F5Y18DRAFT_434712 [Xylariaceae sp. FL1019]|nr:hypothetical protein F5Y18DRAFT_434712 [Xylariaceae sp. FL1019]